MKLFKREKQTKSIDELKASGAVIGSAEAINSITGGNLAGCHTGGKMSFAYNYGPILNTQSLQMTAMRI